MRWQFVFVMISFFGLIAYLAYLRWKLKQQERNQNFIKEVNQHEKRND